MREIDDDEYRRLILECFNEDGDIHSSLDQWVMEGYSDLEILDLLTIAKKKAQRIVDSYFEEKRKEKLYNDASDNWEEHG